MRAQASMHGPATTTTVGRTLASPPGPERGRPILLQLRTGPDLLLQWRLGWPGGRMRLGGADWCSPTSKSKLPLPCTVRTRASSAETRGCRVVQSRSRPFFMLQSNVPCVPDIREGCCKRFMLMLQK
jgi:hypothetical protein